MAHRSDFAQTLEDLYRLQSDARQYELSHGHLVSEPPPGARHGRIAMRIGYALEAYARKSGRGVVLTCDTWFVLARDPDTVRGPDVAWVSSDRYRALADEARPFPGAPDLAVEVLSPGDRRADVDAKVADYLENGTVMVWIADPHARQVRVYQDGGEIIALDMSDMLTAPDLLPGFGVAVRDILRSEP